MEEIRLTIWYGKYPIIFRVLYIPGGWEWDFFHQQYFSILLQIISTAWSGGEKIAPEIQALADSLVSNNAVDQWMIVDHSPSYLLRPLATVNCFVPDEYVS